MKLEDIGFYTLSDGRADNACQTSNLYRCELILTSRCNFRCPYCRGAGGKDLSFIDAELVVRQWAADGLKNIRFSGGEPTLYDKLSDLCKLSRFLGIERVAVSTNGSATKDVYNKLLDNGVNDFSISLDACCSEDSNQMSGGVKDFFDIITTNIQQLSTQTYVTVGVVLTDTNKNTVNNIVSLANRLGVSDIRVIPAAQDGAYLSKIVVDSNIVAKYPILKYRLNNIQIGRPIRGLREGDARQCGLVLDDMVVSQNNHYPCIIYMREGGQAIGSTNANMRSERQAWYEKNNTFCDPICRSNCLDVCVDYNNRFAINNSNALKLN